MLFSSSTHQRSPSSCSVEDLTRFGLLLLNAPIMVGAGGVLIGLIGRWISGRRVVESRTLFTGPL